MINWWDKVMEVTGAAIAPDKCWWYLIDFEWNKGVSSIVDAADDKELFVRNKNGIEEKISLLSCAEAKEMLGVYLTPNGNEDKQKTEMKKKSENWGLSTIHGGLKATEVWTALTTGLLKSLEYPLAATSLSKKDFRTILSPALGPALSACGFPKSFPRSILYAPTQIQGLGVRNLYHAQSCRHVKDILEQTWKRSPSQKFIQLTLEAVKLEAGAEGHLFDKTIDIDWITTKNLWAINTLQFCQKYHIQFKEPGASITLKRIGDITIMEGLRKAGFTLSTLRIANRCRIYLQVTTLSDIATGDGSQLNPSVFEQTPFFRDHYNWPRQGKPPPKDWNVWNYVVKHCFQPMQRLHPHLGHWTVDSTAYKSDWDFFLTIDDTLIWQCNGEWIYFDRVKNDRGRFGKYDANNPRRRSRTSPRGMLWRTTARKDGCHWITHGRDYNVQTDVITPTHEEAEWDTLPDAMWICNHLQGQEHIHTLRQRLDLDGLIAVSDGSFDRENKLGTAAWTIASMDGEIRISGGGVVPGNPSDNSAFRSEVSGILGVMTALQTMFPKCQGEVIVSCDGEGAVEAAFKNRESCSSTNKCFDIISRIIDLTEESMLTIIPRHVKGHQDNHSNELDVAAWLNVQMDEKAKQILHQARRLKFRPPTRLPQSQYGFPVITCDGTSIASNVEKSLIHNAALADGKSWWIEKGRFNSKTWDLVDWDVIEGTMAYASFHRKRFITKWVTNMHPTNVRQHKIKMQETELCGRCHSHAETLKHVVQCRNTKNEKLWKTNITMLDTKLRKLGTDPDIIRAFVLIMIRWHNVALTPDYCPRHVKATIKTAVQLQHEIGWDEFVKGAWSTEWSKCQRAYFKKKKKRNTGKRWAIKVSNQIWDSLKIHWDHRNKRRQIDIRSETYERREELLDACQLELDFGPLDLDDELHHYFETDMDVLEEEKTHDIKLWFYTIRKAREESGFVYHVNDRVSDELRRWVGLSMEKQYRK